MTLMNYWQIKVHPSQWLGTLLAFGPWSSVSGLCLILYFSYLIHLIPVWPELLAKQKQDSISGMTSKTKAQYCTFDSLFMAGTVMQDLKGLIYKEQDQSNFGLKN